MTQSATANAEQSAATSEELNSQEGQMKVYIRELVKMVGKSANGATSLRSALPTGNKHKGVIHKPISCPVFPLPLCRISPAIHPRETGAVETEA